jgi:flagellar hook-length control protein FliK
MSTQTIDIGSYVSTTTDTQAVKSYVDNSSSFGNIFENINKNYSSNNSDAISLKTTFNANNDTTASFKDDKNNIKDNTNTTENNTPSNQKETSQTSSDASVQEETINENKNVENVENVENVKNDEENENVEYTSESKEQTTMETQLIPSEPVQRQNGQTEAPVTLKATKSQAKTSTITTEAETDTITDSDSDTQAVDFEKIAQDLISEVKINNSDTTTETNSETEAQTSDVTVFKGVNLDVQMENIIAALTQVTQTDDLSAENVISGQTGTTGTQETQNSTNTNVNNNLTKILNNLNNNANSVKSQNPQTSSDVNSSIQDNLTQTASLPEQASLPDQNADTKVPLISVESEAQDLDVNSKNTQTELLNKTSLTQEVIDKTNAKVVNVETSSFSNQNSNNGSLGKQTTQEQVLKLEIADDTPVQNTETVVPTINLTAATDTSTGTQTDFSNNINNTQTQTTTQSQTPKDITQNDIISQISKQINSRNLSDEGSTKITMVLRPENLGKINLELVNSKEGLTAQLTTENPQVKEILDKNLNSLKDSLSSQGVSVNNVSVKVNETQKESGSDMSSFGNQMGQNSQESSDNTNQTNEKEFSFDNKTGGMSKSSDSETEVELDSSTQNETEGISLDGRIDYKV